MEEKSMTALICAFSRAYHFENNKVKILDDRIAKLLLSKEEYSMISKNMTQGIKFFNPLFEGDDVDALRWVVDHQLSPTPLSRTAFAERALKTAVKLGVEQYMILAAGYDTYAYRQPEWAKDIQIYEIDHPATSTDKLERLNRGEIRVPENVHFIKADFLYENWTAIVKESLACDNKKPWFCSMLGMVYYFSKQEFNEFIGRLSSIIPFNSTIVFDYPAEHYFSEKNTENKHAQLAAAAKEEMKACHTYNEMEKILEKNDFLIYEHLDSEEMTEQFFADYNEANPNHRMSAQKNVSYCLAVKKIPPIFQ